MSDLCHNCGDCHLGALPVVCSVDLQQCTICGCWGHTFNFCPKGIRQVDPNYMYWMLCHNCDKWHLPSPCPEPYRQCNRCGNLGHVDYFCAADPKPRDRSGIHVTGGTASQNGAKPKNPFTGVPCSLTHLPRGIQFPVTRPEHINPNFLAVIRTQAVMNAMQLINRGFSTQQVTNHFLAIGSVPTNWPLTPATVVNSGPVPVPEGGDPDETQAQNLLEHEHIDSASAAAPATQNAKRRRTSTIPAGSQDESVPAVPQAQQPAVVGGDQSGATSISSTVALPPATPAAQVISGNKSRGKPTSKSRSISNRKPSVRCAACAHAHKACKHLKNSDQKSREASITSAGPPATDRQQASASIQLPKPEQSPHPDDVFSGNAEQHDQDHPTRAGALQPHDQADLEQLPSAAPSPQQSPGADSPNLDVFQFDDNGQASYAGGAVQEHVNDTIEVAGRGLTAPANKTKAPAKKRGGNRKRA